MTISFLSTTAAKFWCGLHHLAMFEISELVLLLKPKITVSFCYVYLSIFVQQVFLCCAS